MGRQIGFGLIGKSVGSPGLRVSCNEFVEYKAGGITIDWSTIVAVSGSDVTLNDGTVIPIGRKYLRYGQPVAKITGQGVLTLTITGTPTGGSLIYTIVRPDTGISVSVTVPFNSSVAAHQTLVNTAFGSGVLTVGGAGVLPANAHTLTSVALGPFSGYTLPTPTLDITGLTGGTPAGTFVVTNAGGNEGMYGPYDPAATDGRQTITPGQFFVLDQTVVELDLITGLAVVANDHQGALVGGEVFKARLIATSGTHTLAAGPTYTELMAALPRLVFTEFN